MNKKYFLFILFCALSSCGFHAIYNGDNISNSSSNAESKAEDYKQKLAAITIKSQKKHIDQKLKNNLEELLNPYNIKTEPRYILTTSLTKSLGGTFTTSSGAVGRNRLILNVTYDLKDLNSGETVSFGTVIAKDDFDVSTTRFANYTAEEAIEINLTKIVAGNIRDRLVNDLRTNPKSTPW